APPSDVAPHWNRPGTFSPLLAIAPAVGVGLVATLPPHAASIASREPLTATRPPARLRKSRRFSSKYMTMIPFFLTKYIKARRRAHAPGKVVFAAASVF